MDELIRTPYGEVRAQSLAALQASFDTRQILEAVDDLDRFCTQWKRELRAEFAATAWHDTHGNQRRALGYRARGGKPQRTCLFYRGGV